MEAVADHCPVAMLSRQCAALLRLYTAHDGPPGHDDTSDAITTAAHATIDAVEKCAGAFRPRSAEGAAFLLVMLGDVLGDLEDLTTPHEGQLWDEKEARLRGFRMIEALLDWLAAETGVTVDASISDFYRTHSASVARIVLDAAKGA